jgi:arylsulfatase A-like enzyme
LPARIVALLLVAICAAATLCTNQLAFAAEKESVPNMVIILADDVGWNDMGAYGHAHIRTPNLDAMANDGLRLDNAFLTCSSCSPSRCSIMTGRFPHSTGAAELHEALPADQIVFAGLLKKAGYYTAAAGKWHLGKAAEVNFDKIVGGGASGCAQWETVLRERPLDKPFFCWFASFDAHRGYAQNTIPQPHTADDAVVPPFLPDEPATRNDLADYYDEITRLDSYVGKVFGVLREQQVADNTLVIFLSDNGRPFPRCKTTVYDSGVKTPFIVRWPKQVKPGGTSTSLVSSVDIAPTLLELAGVELPSTLQGKSFAKILADPQHTTQHAVFAEHNWHDYQAHERSVRTADHLYIRNALPQLTGSPPADAVRSPTYHVMQQLEAAGKLPPEQRGCFIAPRPAEELYDVQRDPHQLSNLADDPKYAAVLSDMQQRLDAWKKRTDDQVPEQPTPDRFDRITGKPIKK